MGKSFETSKIGPGETKQHIKQCAEDVGCKYMYGNEDVSTKYQTSQETDG